MVRYLLIDPRTSAFERIAAQLHGTPPRHLDTLLPNKRGALRIVPACVVGMVILCAARSLRDRAMNSLGGDRRQALTAAPKEIPMLSIDADHITEKPPRSCPSSWLQQMGEAPQSS
jgi:hypothetical protein